MAVICARASRKETEKGWSAPKSRKTGESGAEDAEDDDGVEEEEDGVEEDGVEEACSPREEAGSAAEGEGEARGSPEGTLGCLRLDETEERLPDDFLGVRESEGADEWLREREDDFESLSMLLFFYFNIFFLKKKSTEYNYNSYNY